MPRLRDYLYLDREKVEDYLAGLGDGAVESIKEITKTAGGSDAVAPSMGTPVDTSSYETVNERTLMLTAKHSFSRLYDTIEGDVERCDDGVVPDELRKGDIVEITADFTPSAVNQMIDSLVGLVDTMQRLGLEDQLADPQSKQVLQMIAVLFPADAERDTTPMISTSEKGAKVLFVAQHRYILRSMDDFEGEMTVFGKVAQFVKPGTSVDLLELLRAVPRSLRRGGMGAEFRRALVSLFESWPTELGGAVSPESLELPGPAYVITPVAVYN